jgi:hypothetical protein
MGNAPRGDGQPSCGHGIDGVGGKAFGGKLAGEGNGMLLRRDPGDMDGDPRDGDGEGGEGDKACDRGPPPACRTTAAAITRLQEVTFDLSQRGVSRGGGSDPRGDAVGCV